MKNINTLNNVTLKTTDAIHSDKPEKVPFTIPECHFAEIARCRTCDHYSSGWCYKHKTNTDPDKWACSSYR